MTTSLFRNPTAASLGLRAVFGRLIPALFPEDKRATYEAQLPEASRNVEITVEALLGILWRYPKHTAAVLQGVQDWLGRYYKTQRNTKDEPHYFVYTDLDATIPFVPEEDTHYAYLIAQVAHVVHELVDAVDAREFRDVVSAFIDANDIGAEAFTAFPTIMVRPKDHNRLTLACVQHVDAPSNCAPSLHIAYSVLLDNIARIYLDPESESLASMRETTLRMIDSVLYTKQHAMIDVSFGMLCAEIALKNRFGVECDIRRDELLERRSHAIPYAEALELYDEIRDQYFRAHSPVTLASLLGEYLHRHSYPTVAYTSDLNRSHFDRHSRRIVTQEE